MIWDEIEGFLYNGLRLDSSHNGDVYVVKLLIVGLGDVGGNVLEFLARTPGIPKLIAADMNEDVGIRKTNGVTLSAAQQEFYPTVEFAKIDLNDIGETAEFLKNTEPELIFNSATLQSWSALALLPSDARARLQGAGLGPWIPLHLALTLRLMKALKNSGIDAHVVSAPYPDVANPILGKLGLAPTVGMGNVDLLIPKIKLMVSKELKIPMRNVSVFMIAHHSLVASLSPGGNVSGSPYFMRILVGDKDITGKFNSDELLRQIAALPLPPPAGRNQMIASSAVKNILAILNDTGELTHAPGPAGLPGGYPVRLSAKGAEVVLPDGMTMDQAIKMNEEAQRYDGIEEIRDDGTVVFTEKSSSIMKETLGYDCEKMSPSDCEKRARELGSLFKAFVGKFQK